MRGRASNLPTLVVLLVGLLFQPLAALASMPPPAAAASCFPEDCCPLCVPDARCACGCAADAPRTPPRPEEPRGPVPTDAMARVLAVLAYPPLLSVLSVRGPPPARSAPGETPSAAASGASDRCARLCVWTT
jgi:hypothetical protein